MTKINITCEFSGGLEQRKIVNFNYFEEFGSSEVKMEVEEKMKLKDLILLLKSKSDKPELFVDIDDSVYLFLYFSLKVVLEF
jgi:hypothetical protein